MCLKLYEYFRPKRSLQKQMQSILAAIGKLRECVQQIENQNPSDASEQDILNRANVLLAQDKKYNKGQSSEFVSSQSDSLAPESPTSASLGLSSFSLNINNEHVDDCSTQRPIGVKKAKGKRKVEDQNSLVIDT
ncbi:hypothetical protein CISIN_1g038041mg, partial [Citrus sinensis]